MYSELGRYVSIGKLHAFECNSDIISRVNGEVISRGEANLIIICLFK